MVMRVLPQHSNEPREYSWCFTVIRGHRIFVVLRLIDHDMRVATVHSYISGTACYLLAL